MNRGGQFSGAYGGFGNANFDKEGDAPEHGIFSSAPARDTHVAKVGANPESTGLAVRVKGQALDLLGPESCAAEVEERQWLEQARAEVAEVLPELSESELELWALLADGSYDAASYAAQQGITVATAYVRANRLRAKMRDLLAA
jgi:DNA-directed RNA polymerase specialized sigma24 family protein